MLVFFVLVIPAEAGIQLLFFFFPVQGFPEKVGVKSQGAGFRLPPE